jgi:hypothetical protein
VRLEMTWGDSYHYCYWPLTNNENIETFVPLAACTKFWTTKLEEHCIEETKRYKWIGDANPKRPWVVWTQNNTPSGTPHTMTLAQIEGQSLFVPVATHGKTELVTLHSPWLSKLNITLSIFNFIALLSYCVIRIFIL